MTVNSDVSSAAFFARFSRVHFALLAVIVAVLAIFAAPSIANAKPSIGYVSLGDSYTAGPFIPNQIATSTPPGCAQSDANYPHLIAKAVSLVSLTDVSCSGATTVNMAGPQLTAAGTNPPQLNALSSNTQIVTLGIGGNDIGFSSIIGSCITNSPAGQPCQDLYVQGGVDQLQARITATAPKVAAVLQAIRTKSPHAEVLVVGYPDILPTSGPGCFPQMPFASNDIPYLNNVEVSLNRMLAQQAHANGDGFVDTYTITRGHDACQSVSDRWIEPIVPVNPAAPVHPNAKGMKAMAAATLIGILLH